MASAPIRRHPHHPPRRAWRHISATLGVFMLLLGLALPALGQAAVQRVEVRLTFQDVTPHRVVQERLEATLQSAAERLLFGRHAAP